MARTPDLQSLFAGRLPPQMGFTIGTVNGCSLQSGLQSVWLQNESGKEARQVGVGQGLSRAWARLALGRYLSG